METRPNLAIHREKIGHCAVGGSAHRPSGRLSIVYRSNGLPVPQHCSSQGSRAQRSSVLSVGEGEVPLVHKAGVRFIFGIAHNENPVGDAAERRETLDQTS
jgi:hypothetical protein